MGLLDGIRNFLEPDPDGFGVKVLSPGRSQPSSAQASAAAGICIAWLAKNFGDAPLVLERRDADGNPEIVTEHPFLERLADPWDDYDQDQMLRMAVWDLLLYGQAFLLEVRAQFGGLPAGLQILRADVTEPIKPEPGFEAMPRGSVGGVKTTLPSGQSAKYRLDEVIWLRWRPTGQLTTAGPLDAVQLAAAGDAGLDAKVLEATLQSRRNHLISPQSGDDTEWDDEQMNKIEGKFVDGGATSGAMMAFGQPVDLNALDFSPRDLAIDTVGFRMETRVASAFGLPAILVGLLSGLRWGNNRASTSALIDQAYDGGLIPVQALVGNALTKQLLWRFYDPERAYKVAFDYSLVPALQTVLTAQEERIVRLVEAGILGENEARQELGYEDDPSVNDESEATE